MEPGASGTSGETSSAAAALGNGGFGEGVESEGREGARERERRRGCAPRRRIGLKGNPGSAVQRPRVAPPASVSARHQPSDRRSERLGSFVRVLELQRCHPQGSYLSFLPALIYGSVNECRNWKSELNYFFLI